MKCDNCGYALQIEYKVCPGCGTPNPFFEEHREDMEKYSREFADTRSAVLDNTRKNAGIMVKLIISLVLITASIIMIILSNKANIGENFRVMRVQANIPKYRAEYNKIEQSGDYLLLNSWFEKNGLNEVPQFSDCLNVFNVCMFYKYVDSYLMEITYPEYMKNTLRDKENYCESIIESYDEMQRYAEAERQSGTNNSEHISCIDSCLEHTKVLIVATFKLNAEQIEKFDEAQTSNERVLILMENWPYEE